MTLRVNYGSVVVEIIPAVERRLARDETFVIHVGPADEEVLRRVTAAIDSLWDRWGEDEGPSLLDAPTLVKDSVAVFVDAKGLGRRGARQVVSALNEHLEGVDVKVRPARGSRRYSRALEATPVLGLQAFRPTAHWRRSDRTVAAVAEVVVPWARSMTDVEPALTGSHELSLGWDELQRLASNYSASPGLWFMCGALPLVFECNMSLDGSVRVCFLGSALEDPEVMRSTGDILRSLAACLPGPPSGTLIRSGQRWADLLDGPGPDSTREGTLRDIVSRHEAPHVALPGLGWSQIIHPSIWASIQPHCADSEVVHLPDGRVEVTFGTADRWHDPESSERRRSEDVLQPFLMSWDDWVPIEREARRKMSEEFRRLRSD